VLGFGEPIKRGFRNNSTFSGRATRAENWWWVLFATIGSLWLALLVWSSVYLACLSCCSC